MFKCKLCSEKDSQVVYLKSLITELKDENKDLLERLLYKNGIAMATHIEPIISLNDIDNKEEPKEAYGSFD